MPGSLFALVFDLIGPLPPCSRLPPPYAAVLDLLRRQDPALAARLHDTRGPKAFTVSPLFGEAGTLWFRVTTADDRLVQAVQALALAGEASLRLGSRELLIGAVGAPPEHPWAGRRSVAEWLAATVEAPPPATLSLQFLTPMAIRRPGIVDRNDPLPTPEGIFGSLIRAWSVWLPDVPAPPVDLLEYVRQTVAVARLEWQTDCVFLYGVPHIGGLGRVTYALRGRDPLYNRWLGRLADLAFFSGIGQKTTMGMGMCRRLSGGEEGHGARTERERPGTGVGHTGRPSDRARTARPRGDHRPGAADAS